LCFPVRKGVDIPPFISKIYKSNTKRK
jgi:hypothetical protein